MKEITAADLRQMEGQEGLILQGCGGPVKEWLDGINELLTKEGILLDGSRFKNVSVFQWEGLTNLLFPLDEVKVNMGKLAMWRLATHPRFGGTWLSDYVPNRLGGFEAKPEQEPQEAEREKPDCELIGQDSNIFNLMGIAAKTLHRSGQREQAEEMVQRIMGGGCSDYSAALGVISEYVNITGLEEPDETQMFGGME